MSICSGTIQIRFSSRRRSTSSLTMAHASSLIRSNVPWTNRHFSHEAGESTKGRNIKLNMQCDELTYLPILLETRQFDIRLELQDKQRAVKDTLRAEECFFFFSSRRRHTRFDCWSSDVCSSD